MDRSSRTYRHLGALVLGGLGAAAATTLSLGHAPGAGAAAIFGADPLPHDSIVALAQPVDGSHWNLVVVRRLQGSTGCWQRLSDGLVQLDSEALSNDAVCNRLQSSSGYSLRAAGQDLRSPWRLRIEHQGQQLVLQAFNPSQGQSIVVGLAPVPEGAGGSVLPAFSLSAGWSVQARSFAGRQLSHVYLNHQEPIAALVARATRPGTLPPLTARREPVSSEAAAPPPGQVIALQVVPYRGDSDLTAANP